MVAVSAYLAHALAANVQLLDFGSVGVPFVVLDDDVDFDAIAHVEVHDCNNQRVVYLYHVAACDD
jgi:hypothetical protein